MLNIILPSVLFWDKLSSFILAVGKIFAVILAILMFLLSNYLGVFTNALRGIAQLVLRYQNLNVQNIESANFNSIEMISYVNGVFPLSEFIAMLTVYSTAWVLIIAIRWIKSFIPTIAN